ncbi:MAG: MFS transporter small subunit [Methylosarcina sp.]
MKSAKRNKCTHPILLLLFWLYVALPLGWGVWSTLKKALVLFN